MCSRDSRQVQFHSVGPDEIVVADSSAVLEMVLNGSVGLILYDPSRRLAAAAQIRAGASQQRFRERTGASLLTLLAGMVQQGSQPRDMEVFLLGTLQVPDYVVRPALRPEGLLPGSLVPLVHLPSGAHGTRRVEFDVSVGRIVLEQERPVDPAA